MGYERSLMKKSESDEEEYPEAIRHQTHMKAFYDNLKEAMASIQPEQFILFIQQLDTLFKEASKKPDWENNNDVKNAIDQDIDDLLWTLEKEHGASFESYDVIINQARSIGINNYAKR